MVHNFVTKRVIFTYILSVVTDVHISQKTKCYSLAITQANKFLSKYLIVKGGLRRWYEEARTTPFSLKIILHHFYRQSVAGKCPGLPFLDPPLLMYAITCAGKSTKPLNSLASCVARA